MEIELKHTWRVSRRAWYIRLYCWLWVAQQEDITFCKLWWGYVFILPALLVRLVLYPVMWCILTPPIKGVERYAAHLSSLEPHIYTGVRRVAGRRVRLGIAHTHDVNAHASWYINGSECFYHTRGENSFKCSRFDEPGTYHIQVILSGGRKINYDLVIKPPSTGMAFLNFVSMLPTRIGFVLDPVVHSKPLKLSGRLLGQGARLLGRVGFYGLGLGAIALCLLGIYEAIAQFGVWTGAVGTGVTALAGAVTSIALYIGLGVLFIFTLIMIFLLARTEGSKQMAKGVEMGAVSFKEAMKIGYVSVKSNTCPRVKVED